MPIELSTGDCFVNKPGRGTPSHLWIVLSDPQRDPDNVLIVNVTDANKHHDESCILRGKRDHEWLKKESCVAYQFAKLTSMADLQKADDAGLLIHKKSLSADVLQRVLDGAYISDELSGEKRELLRSQGLID